MSSPIRTPASFSWVSSGNGYGNMGAGMSMGMGMSNGMASGGGGGGGAFDSYPGTVGSLNGVANAWGHSQNPGTSR